MTSGYDELLGEMLSSVVESPFVRGLGEDAQVQLIHDRFYADFVGSGMTVVASLDGRVMAINFHSEGHEGHKGFKGPLPEHLSFVDHRETVRSRLGKASASGGGDIIPFLGRAALWDRFDRRDYSVHVQYDDDETVSLVTLIRADSVPT